MKVNYPVDTHGLFDLKTFYQEAYSRGSRCYLQHVPRSVNGELYDNDKYGNFFRPFPTLRYKHPHCGGRAIGSSRNYTAIAQEGISTASTLKYNRNRDSSVPTKH